MIDTLRALMDKVASTQEQMVSVSREMEILRIKKETLLIKNTATEMQNAFDGLLKGGRTQLREESLRYRIYQ